MANMTTTRPQRIDLRQPLAALVLVAAGLIAGLALPHLAVLSSGATTTAGAPAIGTQAGPVWRHFRAEEWADSSPVSYTTGPVDYTTGPTWRHFRAQEWADSAPADYTTGPTWRHFRAQEWAATP